MRLFGQPKDAPSQDPYEKKQSQSLKAQRSAMQFLQDKLYGHAEADFRRAVDLDPESVTAHAYLGIVLHKIGRLGEAADELGIAINLTPDDESLWRTRGTIKESLNDIQGATIDYQMALQLDNTQPLAHAALGGVMVKTGDLHRADFHLRRALELEPRDPAALADLARVRQLQGALSEAVGALRGALSLLADRGHPPVVRTGGLQTLVDSQADLAGRLQARLGLLLESNYDVQGAITALRAAHEAIPNDTEILREYARILMETGRASEALALYKRAEKAFPANWDRYEDDLGALVAGSRAGQPEQLPAAREMTITGSGRLIGADAVANLQATSDALRELEELIRVEPSNRAARRDLSVAYLRAGRIAEAKEQARIAEELRSHRTGGIVQPS